MNKPVTASTGLTTVGARTYDPVLGKFLSVDPVIDTNLPQQNTGYTYSGNNPTTYMDPTGLRLQIDCPSCKGGVLKTKDPKPLPTTKSNKPKKSCGAGDWGCRVELANSEKRCAGGGRLATCKRTSGFPYDYTVVNPVVRSSSGWTAQGVMSMFQKNPTEVFPFTVKGCSQFKTGAECKLQTGLDILLNPNGLVGVDTTSTSVKFTVIASGYFDAPGSTITFSTYEDKGMIYLRQDAYSVGSDGYVALALDGVLGLPPASANTWHQQSLNLVGLLSQEEPR